MSMSMSMGSLGDVWGLGLMADGWEGGYVSLRWEVGDNLVGKEDAVESAVLKWRTLVVGGRIDERSGLIFCGGDGSITDMLGGGRVISNGAKGGQGTCGVSEDHQQ